MLLVQPSPTEFDLRFRLLGVPVRVHPFFWLFAAMLGWSGEQFERTLAWVGCAFVSILVHEFGHALMARRHGAWPSVVLYSFGGLCVYDDIREAPRQRLATLFWGPGAGFVLCGLTMVAGYLLFGLTWRDDLLLLFPRHLPRLLGLGMGEALGFQMRLSRAVERSEMAVEVFFFLLQINLWWGLLNLFPVWPLDGGQMAAVAMKEVSPRHGRRRAHIVSLLTASGLALWMYSQDRIYATILFGLLALQNYQVLQALHHQYTRYGLDEDGADWWKR